MATKNIDNSSDLANDLYNALVSGINVPDTPDFKDSKFVINTDKNSVLYKEPKDVDISEVFGSCKDDNSTFEAVMASVDRHIKEQFELGRITSSQYADVYLAILQTAISTASSFVLQKEQAKWAAIKAQMDARISEIQATEAEVTLEKTKLEAAKMGFDMHLAGANFSLTKMKIATEEAQHDVTTLEAKSKDFEVHKLLPIQKRSELYKVDHLLKSENDGLKAKTRLTENQNRTVSFEVKELLPLQKKEADFKVNELLPIERDTGKFNLDKILSVKYQQEQAILNDKLPAEIFLTREQAESERAKTVDKRSDGLGDVTGVLGLQKRGLGLDNENKEYVLDKQLPAQVDLIKKQINLTQEQRESERAKTHEERSDGSFVAGSIAKQKDLIEQQIDSFQRSSEQKLGDMVLKAWITQKTLDEGIQPPEALKNNSLQDILEKLKTSHKLS